MTTRKNALPVTRNENFPEWYQAVITNADMAEASGVRGCMIIKPWGYKIWERIQRRLDDGIQATGHDNCYFPLFIPLELIQQEATHVEGFAREMAVVTHHRLEMRNGKLQPAAELDSPLVVRPTSEAMITPAFKRWIRSYRDLPVKINQWSNVVRWEMRPRMFLRTSEFLWQEGHTVHATSEEAIEETRTMLKVYQNLLETFMSIPVIPGVKSPGERFPGAVETHTIEALMQDGRALQAGTSHYLGQNFAEASDLGFVDKNGERQIAYTTSWGASTRLIGALIMVHADDDGLRLPPTLAPYQVVIVPILRGDDGHQDVINAAKQLEISLQSRRFDGDPVRVFMDLREDNPTNKRWNWMKKGVPLVCELGKRDIVDGKVAIHSRLTLSERAVFVDRDLFVDSIEERLEKMQRTIFDEARLLLQNKTIHDVRTLADLKAVLDQEGGFVCAKWLEDENTEASLKEFGATIRCLPYEQSNVAGKCIITGRETLTDVIIAKAY